MNKEKLIEEVRIYPYLYDPCDTNYSDTIKSDQAWKNIAGVLSAPAPECKKVWINLREAYRRALKKKKTKSGQAASSSKKWKFEEEMSFLLPYFKQRSTLSSITDNEEIDTMDDDSLSLNDINEFISNKNNSQTGTNTSAEDNRPQSSSLDSAPTLTPLRPVVSNPTFFANITKANKRQRKDDTTSASGQLLKFLLDEKQKKPEDDDDEIDKFFCSIKATVKKMSAYNQAVLKTKIFNLVSAAEIQEIQQQNYYYNSPSAGPSRYNTGSGFSSYNTEKSKTQTSNEDAESEAHEDTSLTDL